MEQIIYEDDQVLVFHKPSGLAVQTSRFGQQDVVSILKNYRAKNRELPYIALINRLDQPVEGLLLVAKTKEAAAALTRQLTEHRLDKCYRAVVRNDREKPLRAGEEGVLTDYLLKDGRTNCSGVVQKGTEGAKKAVLKYRVEKVCKCMAELYIELCTGRHHQIRVQMANAALPILGDLKYGRGAAAEGFEMKTPLALCSVKIIFMHPKSMKKMEFEIEPENPSFQLLCGFEPA